MLRRAPLGCLVMLLVAGCQAPARRLPLGPPPSPILGTRPPPAGEPFLPPPPFVPPPIARADLRGVTIVVDPGHGGEDPGALGRGSLPEKAVNLAIGRELAQILQQQGANVVMTRSTDRFISLEVRAAIAERHRADLFVSVHADSARRSTAEGATIYVGRTASGASREAAHCILAALRRAGIETNGVQSAGFRVLIAHARPAVLVECGFLSNAGEARRLSTPAYQERVAEAIAEGIGDYFGR